MGLTAIVSSSAASATSPSLLATAGIGVAGIFVTALLVYLLAYLNVVEASERQRHHLRSMLVSASIPLAIAFTGMIAYESLTIIGIL